VNNGSTFDDSVSFNGVNNTIVLDQEFNLSTFTILARVYVVNGSNDRLPFLGRNVGSYNDFVGYKSSDSRILMEFNDGTAYYGYANYGFEKYTWQNFALVYDGAEVTGYIDGVSQGTDAQVGKNIKLQMLGAGYASEYFNGSVENLYIYNRSLTEDELTAYFSQQFEPKDSFVRNGQDINPIVTAIHNLGSSVLRWAKGWFVDLDVSGTAIIENATITNLNVTSGLNGDCLNVTYSQGVAITCND